MCNSGSTMAQGHAGGHTAEPLDAVIDRLNDPAVADAMVTLLDNAELLSTLVLGLAGFMERGDTMMESVAESVNGSKDPDVQKGMGVLVEIARSIGRRM